jgi:predicted nucleic-acid-binding protein
VIAIDTNVLIRILIEDSGHKEQNRIARELAISAKRVYIPQIVQVETVWVLETAYKFDKTNILKVLDHIQSNGAFVLQSSDIFSAALDIFHNCNADFSDCLILAESRKANMKLYTFDKRLSRQNGAESAMKNI